MVLVYASMTTMGKKYCLSPKVKKVNEGRTNLHSRTFLDHIFKQRLSPTNAHYIIRSTNNPGDYQSISNVPFHIHCKFLISPVVSSYEL